MSDSTLFRRPLAVAALVVLRAALAPAAAGAGDLVLERVLLFGALGAAGGSDPIESLRRDQRATVEFSVRFVDASSGTFVATGTLHKACAGESAPLRTCRSSFPSLFSRSGSFSQSVEMPDCVFTLPDPGHYVFRLRLDPDNAVAESNEGNNELAKTFFVETNAPQVTPPTVTVGELFAQRTFTRRRFSVFNGGPGPLAVRVAPDTPAPWLEIRPAAFTVPSCGSQQVELITEWSPTTRTQVKSRRLVISSAAQEASVDLQFSLGLCPQFASASPPGGGTVATTGSKTCGEVEKFDATPAPGFRFVRWRIGSTTISRQPSLRSFNSGLNQRLVAEFERAP